MSSKEKDVLDLKAKGNDSIREGNYEEAIAHYTEAIQLDPKNSSLYSNRSFAYLKLQKYYFALEDAKVTILLQPDWAKGYFRKAEVEYATHHFPDAYQSYNQALLLKPDDCDIAKAITNTSKEWERDIKADEQIPWLGAGIGIVLGVAIVIADFICTKKPTLSNPILMVSLTISVAVIGYFAAKAFRYYVKCERKSLLEIPLSLEGELPVAEDVQSPTDKTPEKPTRNHYSKIQARFRYKKGKL